AVFGAGAAARGRGGVGGAPAAVARRSGYHAVRTGAVRSDRGGATCPSSRHPPPRRCVLCSSTPLARHTGNQRVWCSTSMTSCDRGGDGPRHGGGDRWGESSATLEETATPSREDDSDITWIPGSRTVRAGSATTARPTPAARTGRGRRGCIAARLVLLCHRVAATPG